MRAQIMKSATHASPTPAALAAVPSPTPLVALIAELDAMFPERHDVISATLTAAVAEENTFILGPRGTAKSALARALSGAFQASYFEYLMSRFTEPSELFGPVDVQAFKAGQYVRVTARKLPEAQVVFLDEIWKSNSAIVNALLTVLNEGTYDAGSGPVAIPLLTCVAASNELPEDDSLAPIYDRFLVRCVVGYVSDRDTFRDLLGAVASGTRQAVTVKVDLVHEQAAARAVKVTDATLDALSDLREACKAAGMKPSDRRWIQCIGLVRAAAHVAGRTVTEPEDLEILESVLWDKPDERQAVARLVQTVISPHGARAVEELDAARDLLGKIPAVGVLSAGEYMGLVGTASRDVNEVLKRLQALPRGRKVDAATAEVSTIKSQIGKLAMRAAGIEL